MLPLGSHLMCKYFLVEDAALPGESDVDIGLAQGVSAGCSVVDWDL